MWPNPSLKLLLRYVMCCCIWLQMLHSVTSLHGVDLNYPNSDNQLDDKKKKDGENDQQWGNWPPLAWMGPTWPITEMMIPTSFYNRSGPYWAYELVHSPHHFPLLQGIQTLYHMTSTLAVIRERETTKRKGFPTMLKVAYICIQIIGPP